jgi:hypothetical protein
MHNNQQQLERAIALLNEATSELEPEVVRSLPLCRVERYVEQAKNKVALAQSILMQIRLRGGQHD